MMHSPVYFEIEIRIEDIEPKKLSKEEQDEMTAQRILDEAMGKETFGFDVASHFRYVPMTIDLTSVGPYNYYDDDHTIIRLLDYNAAFMVKINYDIFKAIREATLGYKTKTLKDFHAVSPR